MTKDVSSLQKDLYVFQRSEEVLTMISFIKQMLCEKGGEGNLFPHFQQGELSLLFLICICSYMCNSAERIIIWFHNCLLIRSVM